MALRGPLLLVAALVAGACSEPAARQTDEAVQGYAAAEEAVPTCPDCPRQLRRGYYRYLADAASFADCERRETFPVLFEGDHRALERAYLAARQRPGDPMMVRLRGTLVQRAPEPGLPPRLHLRVDEFLMVLPDHDCDGPIERRSRPARPLEAESEPLALALVNRSTAAALKG